MAPVISLFMLALLLLTSCGSSPSAGWRIVSSPIYAQFDASLSSVAAISSSDVWAVGSIGYQPLMEHWNGTRWSAVSGPFIEAAEAALNGVAAVSSKDVWAVGLAYAAGSLTDTLIEHWNGTSWSIVPSPNVVDGGNILSGVAAVSATDVWAVGSSRVLGSSGSESQTLIEHWNGSGWSIVPSPNQAQSFSILHAVTGISSNDVWAVGSATAAKVAPGTGHPEPWGSATTLIEHWNGAQWSVVPSANKDLPSSSFNVSNTLYAVSAVSAGDIWAVGTAVGPNSLDTLVEQWNGSGWRLVPSPSFPSVQADVSPGSGVYGVTAISPYNIWAVGATATAEYTDKNLVMHWDGTSWTIVPSPNGYYGKNSLSAVTATSPDDIWAVGSDEPLNVTHKPNQGLVVHGP
jgi:hypothetical protein